MSLIKEWWENCMCKEHSSVRNECQGKTTSTKNTNKILGKKKNPFIAYHTISG